MPTIAVNLGSVVSAFEDLPFGSYLAEVAKIKLREPTQAGKFAQLMITWLVIDGDQTGRKQTQFLSLSPNAMGFVKEFFGKFGYGDIPNLEIDDDSEELTDPDLYGVKGIINVAPDRKDPDRTRIKLVSVEDDMTSRTAPSAPPVSRAARPAHAVEEVEEEEVEDPKAAAKAARIAAAQAALAAAEEEDDEDEPEAPPAKPARTAAPRPAASANGKPERRTLR